MSRELTKEEAVGKGVIIARVTGFKGRENDNRKITGSAIAHELTRITPKLVWVKSKWYGEERFERRKYAFLVTETPNTARGLVARARDFARMSYYEDQVADAKHRLKIANEAKEHAIAEASGSIKGLEFDV